MSADGLARIGSYYAVSPGPAGTTEYFTGQRGDADLGALGEAMSRAKFWSADGSRQTVTVTRGRSTRVIRAYEGGRDVTANGIVLVPVSRPPAPEPEQVTVTDFRARRTRKPRYSVRTPPCDAADD